MENETNSLQVYIGYEEYLTAAQLSDLLGHLNGMYNALFLGMSGSTARPVDLQEQMRVHEVRTGNSVELTLVEGIQTLIQAGPSVTIPAALGVMSLAAKLLVSAAKGVVELRKMWHEGTKAKYEAQAAKGKELSRERQEERHVAPQAIPVDAMRAATNAAGAVINLVEFSPNITIFCVNGTNVLPNGEHFPGDTRV